MNLELENKIVLVTGATGGIGHSIVLTFLKEGATVLAGYRGSSSKLNLLFDEAKELGYQNKLFPIEINLGDVQVSKTSIDQAIEKHLKVDVLVNCAAITVEKPFLLMNDHDIESQVDINFSAQLKLTQHVLKYMLLAKSGNIVNVSSLLGRRFGRGVTVYASLKASLDKFTQALAMEVGRKGIRVNAVAPGMIATKMSSQLQKNIPDQYLQMSAISRAGTAEEVANGIVFLSSDAVASYITGHCLIIDGGIGI